MNKFLIFTATIIVFFASSLGLAYAESSTAKVNNPDIKNSSNVLATVNGTDIQKDTIEGLVLIAKKQGAQDTR